MKQKINIRLVVLSMMAVLLTVCLITIAYYDLFQDQVRGDLRTTAQLLAGAGVNHLKDNDTIKGEQSMRVTWISEQGEVLFDNDASNLGNHMDRPEVQEAFQNGVGSSTRKSDTMNMRTFYYAILLEDGTVLRVATEARSISSVFLSAFPAVLFIFSFVIVLCVILSHLLTRQLIEPINRMAEELDSSKVTVEYKELQPFVTRIREQHRDILAAAKSRQDFTANVSHELKTPITAISGYAELIENKMVDEQQQTKFAGEIRKHADRLVCLVNDIIRLSELDQAENLPEFTRIDLYELAQERLELLENNARQKNVTLSLHGEHCMVRSDRNLLEELIDNLVQNAIRYNKKDGRVDIYVEPSDNQICLRIKDTGIGIPEEDRQRVFERFYRVDKGRSRETGGTGLGLAIVRHIVDLHGGNIELDSEVGKGTTISITLS